MHILRLVLFASLFGTVFCQAPAPTKTIKKKDCPCAYSRKLTQPECPCLWTQDGVEADE